MIAWDGKTLAADKRMTCAGAVATTTKIRRLQTTGGFEVLAWTGDQDSGEIMAQWYERGADPDKWPDCQKDKEAWCRLIVAACNGVQFYERQPVSVRVEDKFCAWGSGRDYALAALHCGKSASEAVQIACLFDNGCGNGIDMVML